MRFLRTAVAGWLLTLGLGGGRVEAQDGWFARYQAQVAARQVNQPNWATPLVTTNPALEQRLRADFTRQTTEAGHSTWNDGGTKGLQLIPFARTEIEISPPPFFDHRYGRANDGFGDVSFRMKVRAYGSDERHHNAIASVLLSASVPTGKQQNGSCCAILTPQVELGKGFGPVALITSFSGTLPVTGTAKLGRSVTWGNAAEVRTLKLVWLTLESTSVYFFGGGNDGRSQTFVTPGVVVSRIPLMRAGPAFPKGVSVTLGAGEQMAVTHFNTYERATVLSGRLRF